MYGVGMIELTDFRRSRKGLKERVLDELRAFPLADKNLNQVIDGINAIDDDASPEAKKLAIIQQLINCYGKFKPEKSSKKNQTNTTSVIDYLWRILKDNPEFNVAEGKPTSYDLSIRLLALLVEANDACQSANLPQQKYDPKLKLSVEILATSSSNLNRVSHEHYETIYHTSDSRVPVLKELGTMLLSSALYVKRPTALNAEFVRGTQQEVNYELLNQDRSLVLIDQKHIIERQNNLLYPLVLHRVMCEGKPTHAYGLSNERAQDFVTIAQDNPQALDQNGNWDVSKIHPDPYLVSLQTLKDTLPSLKFLNGNQQMALPMVTQLIKRSEKHRDAQFFKKDVTDTLTSIQEFFKATGWDGGIMLPKLQAAGDKCVQNLEALVNHEPNMVL